MFNYVYMKILESQPRRYDRGVRWLSFGQSAAVMRRIAETIVFPGMHLLDIGCGTGTLAVLAAQKGARVTGFDVSSGMLSVAREKVARAGLDDQITLQLAGLARLSKLPPASFDAVTATLVFSELSSDQQSYTLSQAHRVLKPNGRLVIADEARPRRWWRRAIYYMFRIPLVVVTYVLTQTTTRAVVDLEKHVAQADFTLQTVERKGLQSFVYLVAIKGES